jgi:hypothetical protein
VGGEGQRAPHRISAAMVTWNMRRTLQACALICNVSNTVVSSRLTFISAVMDKWHRWCSADDELLCFAL